MDAAALLYASSAARFTRSSLSSRLYDRSESSSAPGKIVLRDSDGGDGGGSLLPPSGEEEVEGGC